MKVSDYIVDFFIKKEISDVFGYPGGMVTHLMESFSNRKNEIKAHVNYHEQASAFAACGYAQVSGKAGVAYATSGPGATNLITGIANAWFDSIPTIFITGQVNTFETRDKFGIRQNGFQETDIVSMVKGITKYCTYISRVEDIRYELEKAWYYANEGRKGPVLLDIPMNVQRGQIEVEKLESFCTLEIEKLGKKYELDAFQKMLKKAKRPVILVGAGVKSANAEQIFQKVVEKWNIPVVSSMISFDVLDYNHSNFYGFVGAYGQRCANFIIAKSDLVIAMGSRLGIRQTGGKVENFAPEAELVRIDIDSNEFSKKIKENELDIECDIKEFLGVVEKKDIQFSDLKEWIDVCKIIKKKLKDIDTGEENRIIQKFSNRLPEDIVITTDVGQNQVWVAQAFQTKKKHRVLFSGGHGAMGYSLPAAIGAYYGSRVPVLCFNGDGGIQMNIQELQFIARERIPITIVILNNSALGMIRHFQEMYFNSNFFQTLECGGYSTPEFQKIANAYGLDYCKISKEDEVEEIKLDINKPQIIEICLQNHTYVFPKLEYGMPNQDQHPLIERELYNYIMQL